jgi:hypothetical protein
LAHKKARRSKQNRLCLNSNPTPHRCAPTVLDRLRTEDEKHLIEMEKRYFGKLSFRKDPAMHAEQFKIVNVENGEELANVGA